MPRKYEMKEEQIAELKNARKSNQNKNADRRLHALILYAEGYTGKQISEITGYRRQYLYELFQKYFSRGIESITRNHNKGNHRNMTVEQESELLEQFTNDADGGYITDVSAIKAAYDEKVGRKTGNGQIYYVLHRHGWTKKMPRSKHPKSAAPEAVEASKKLTHESKK